MLIPAERLSSEILESLIEEFITREGTDYGLIEVDLFTKVAQIKAQISRGDVVIVFDSTSETTHLMTKQQYQQWSVE